LPKGDEVTRRFRCAWRRAAGRSARAVAGQLVEAALARVRDAVPIDDADLTGVAARAAAAARQVAEAVHRAVSTEWYAITATPAGRSAPIAASNPSSSAAISSFTAIRSA
jgi:hypothetical protein